MYNLLFACQSVILSYFHLNFMVYIKRFVKLFFYNKCLRFNAT